jgi:hypothetical protein
MFIGISDVATISESEATIFSFVQTPGVPISLFLVNSGSNTINYDFQELISGVWTDMDQPGTDLQNTLSPGQVKLIQVVASVSQVQLLANASGGSILAFNISRQALRVPGGQLPILAV